MRFKPFGFPIFTLMGSVSTLFCCVLPALFVALGFGSVVASVVGNFPQLIWLSEHKSIVFGIAGLMIALSGFWEWRRRNDPCPIDPELAKACGQLRRISRRLWALSFLIYLGSVFFVFVLPRLM